MSYNVKEEIESITNLVSSDGAEMDVLNELTRRFEDVCKKLGYNFSYMLTKDAPEGVKTVSRARCNIAPDVSDEVRFLNMFQHMFVKIHFINDINIEESKRLYDGIDTLFKDTIDAQIKRADPKEVMEQLIESMKKDKEEDDDD